LELPELKGRSLLKYKVNDFSYVYLEKAAVFVTQGTIEFSSVIDHDVDVVGNSFMNIHIVSIRFI